MPFIIPISKPFLPALTVNSSKACVFNLEKLNKHSLGRSTTGVFSPQPARAEWGLKVPRGGRVEE